MKKILLFLLVATLGCGNVYSQTKKPVRRTASVAAKQKAEAEAKAKAEAEAKAKAEAEEKARISENNMKCKFSLETGDFISQQGYENYDTVTGTGVWDIPKHLSQRICEIYVKL